MNLRKLLNLQTYQPLNLIEISEGNLLHNYKVLTSINRGVRIAPVLKSNAYGHGLVLVAKILDQVGAPFFCVDSIYEAYELLKAKITTPILIMGYINPENMKVKKLPFSYALWDLELAHAISNYQPHAGVHIFVDTGMNREGIPLIELPQFIRQLKKLPNINIEGLMSHFASADNEKDPLNELQIKDFKKALEICKNNGIHPEWIHLANSDGLLNPKVSTQHTPGVWNVHTPGNLARVGLALYGISNRSNLKPVLTFRSRIIQIKKLKKEDRVGYSGAFIVKNDMTIGILPLGYYDGVDRRLSNKGFVTVDRVKCPIIGLVSMNITTIDLSGVKNPHIGQDVFVYSNNPKNKNSIENSAKICKTIPYDLLVHLASSTKRIIA